VIGVVGCSIRSPGPSSSGSSGSSGASFPLLHQSHHLRECRSTNREVVADGPVGVTFAGGCCAVREGTCVPNACLESLRHFGVSRITTISECSGSGCHVRKFKSVIRIYCQDRISTGSLSLVPVGVSRTETRRRVPDSV